MEEKTEFDQFDDDEDEDIDMNMSCEEVRDQIPCWIYTNEFIRNDTPSRKAKVDYAKELYYRQHAASLIQSIGLKLKVNQLCVNTAIVFMHRFYMLHSFTVFHRVPISVASLYLSCKVEEQPCSLERVIKVSQHCLDGKQLETDSVTYKQWGIDIIKSENVVIQSVGFEVNIDHPHTHIVRICELVKAHKNIAKTAYHMTTSSLHLTTMYLEHKPNVIGCVAMNVAAKRHNWIIPKIESQDWFWYVEKDLTAVLLERYTKEFLAIYENASTHFKQIIYSVSYPRNNEDDSSSTTSPASSGGSDAGTPHHSNSKSL